MSINALKIFAFLKGFILICFVFALGGDLYWVKGWICLAIDTISLIGFIRFLIKNNLHLLKERTQPNKKDQAKIDKIIYPVLGMSIGIFFSITSIDAHLLRLSPSFPVCLSYFGFLLNILSYFGFWNVIKNNPYLFATIKTESNQKVTSSGLYGVVRHPMYLCLLLKTVGIALFLGSSYGLIWICFPLLPALLWRMLAEEKNLQNNLTGYKDYMKKIKYRIIPSIF